MRQNLQLKSKLLRKRRPTTGTGRWSIWPAAKAPDDSPAKRRIAEESNVEQWAWQLLRRWGVVFKDILARESGTPSWFDLLQIYRRLEARGEIRGGRFVSGVAGEQFAAGDTVKRLRQLRDASSDQANVDNAMQENMPELTVISASDPLNLTGILTSMARIPSLANNRIALLDGKPVAALRSGQVIRLDKIPEQVVAAIAAGFEVDPLEIHAGLHEAKPQQSLNGESTHDAQSAESAVQPA